MPAMDGTGPRGAGARTGRGLGRCRTTDARRNGAGSGSGFGRGFRKGFGCAMGLGFGCCCFGLGMRHAVKRRKGACGSNGRNRSV